MECERFIYLAVREEKYLLIRYDAEVGKSSFPQCYVCDIFQFMIKNNCVIYQTLGKEY